MRSKIFLAGLAAAALMACHASAGPTLLVDTFNQDAPPVFNWPGDTIFKSTGAPGSVDLIGSPPPFFDLRPGHGYYVDLDGTTGTGNDPAGQLTSTGVFGPGTYTLHFYLAGNVDGEAGQFNAFTPPFPSPLNGGSNSTTVSLGDFSKTITLTTDTPFTLYSYTFTTTQAGKLVFTEHGPSDENGNLLDNVGLNAGVPEPATWAMMLMGFGGLGSLLRARRRSAALA